jgi:hypothetical protein
MNCVLYGAIGITVIALSLSLVIYFLILEFRIMADIKKMYADSLSDYMGEKR